MLDVTQGHTRCRILGLDIDALALSQVCELCRRAVEEGKPLTIGVVNAAKLVRARNDASLREAIIGCDLVLADGMSVVWASRLLGERLPERVAGIDLFEALLHLAAHERWSVYFFGATEDVLEDMLRQVRRAHPGLRIAGAHHGYVDDSGEGAVAESIRALRPDLLFLGMSSPKKELFIGRYGRQLGAGVCHGVGGAFDVLAGKVARAPRRWQSLGLEWLYRVLQEPRRLWRRYLTTNVAFLWLVGRDWLRQSSSALRRKGI